ncbi:hypothetical protein F5Y07DRAFT_363022 [Xylaria sp. FL0933]|nr:hypothetical protein F5Y07DRAFT_363022 [Xylaria sp. FL0933]
MYYIALGLCPCLYSMCIVELVLRTTSRKNVTFLILIRFVATGLARVPFSLGS